jgi:methylmalonyl-CoA mutase, C-terminal domain
MSDMQEERKFMRKKYRILLAKPGLDGHDRGIKVVAAALRDAGFEVIYTGLRQTAEMIVEAAIQEDVAAIGMSILSGAHMTLFPAVLDLLKKRKCEHIILFGGGIIPDEDISKLEKKGVGKLFTPGATTSEIIKYLNEILKEGRKEEAVF